MGTIMRRKRIERKAESARPEPPITLVVRPEVIGSIAAAAGAAGRRETGEPLIGMLQPSWDESGKRLIVSVLGTIPPGPQLRASVASVGLGATGDGERAASALRWWRKVTGLDLRHLGDWHKHPAGSPRPSQGDRATARRMKIETESAVWLSAISVCERVRTQNFYVKDRAVAFSDGNQTCGQVCFFRETRSAGLIPITARIEADAIPALPGLPWHITDPVRFAAEVRLLQAAGFATATEPSVSSSGAGLTLRLTSPHGRRTLTVMTGSRYPATAPTVLDGQDRKARLGKTWSPNRFLVDVVEEAQ
jgi:hypothetical protein